MRRPTDLAAAITKAHSCGRLAIASMAPSFAGFFEGPPDHVLSVVSALGFDVVEETAVGIAGSAGTALGSEPSISSACPRIVHLVESEFPHLADRLSRRPTALAAHCLDLRGRYGSSCLIAFFGPCRYKRWEKRKAATSADIFITFTRLKRWLAMSEHEIAATSPDTTPGSSTWELLIPGRAERVAVLQTGISGLQAVRRVLSSDRTENVQELLACTAGCLGGPGDVPDDQIRLRQARIVSWALRE